MDTGHAVTFGAATVRNLLRVADFLPPPYLIGLLLTAFHPRGKRLGRPGGGNDRGAGPARRSAPRSPRAAAEEAAEPSIPELGDEEFRLLSQFAARQGGLEPAARARLTTGLAARLAAHPAPPGHSDLAHLLALHTAEQARREGRLSARGAAGAGTRFAAQKRQRWDEFERLADRAAREGLDSFASHELPDFAARYREVAADLARARTYRADAATQGRLERLAAAGHNTLYRDDRETWRRLWAVLARECPAAVVQARGYVFVAFLTFMAPAAAGFAVLHERPALAGELLPDVMLRRAEAGAARKAAGRGYVDVAAEDRPLMASGIITNNVRVAIACFAGGIFLGVGSLVLLAYNGLAIGAFAGHFANVGLLDYLLTFILGHGALELFAIWVAGAAGFLLGRSVVAPGRPQPGGRAGPERAGRGADARRHGGAAGGRGRDRGVHFGGRVQRAGPAGRQRVEPGTAGGLSGQRPQISRSIVRIRIASASISRRLVTVVGSICASLSSSSWVSASSAESGLERSCRSLAQSLGVGHARLGQRLVEGAEMVPRQGAHRFPQLGFRGSAEDFRRLAHLAVGLEEAAAGRATRPLRRSGS